MSQERPAPPSLMCRAQLEITLRRNSFTAKTHAGIFPEHTWWMRKNHLLSPSSFAPLPEFFSVPFWRKWDYLGYNVWRGDCCVISAGKGPPATAALSTRCCTAPRPKPTGVYLWSFHRSRSQRTWREESKGGGRAKQKSWLNSGTWQAQPLSSPGLSPLNPQRLQPRTGGILHYASNRSVFGGTAHESPPADENARKGEFASCCSFNLQI